MCAAPSKPFAPAILDVLIVVAAAVYVAVAPNVEILLSLNFFGRNVQSSKFLAGTLCFDFASAFSTFFSPFSNCEFCFEFSFHHHTHANVLCI